jgi:hypothetical protein
MVAAGWLLVDVHSGRGLGVAGALIFAGATPLLADVLRRSPSFDSAVQLLLGVGIIFFVLALMLLATYLGWLDPHSGVHDYVTFSLIVFGGIFGLRIRWTAVERRCSLWAVWGYFACLVGAFMLKSVAMTFLIRRFH